MHSRHGDAWGHNTWTSESMGWPDHSFAFPCTYCVILSLLIYYYFSGRLILLGKWIFKGYPHDQNFVGRWRNHKRGFVVNKTDNTGD